MSLVVGLGSGPVLDDIGRRKAPVVLSTVVMAVALLSGAVISRIRSAP